MRNRVFIVDDHPVVRRTNVEVFERRVCAPR